MTPWTVACQAPLPMELSRQVYLNGEPFPSPGHLSNPGIKLGSPALSADSLPAEPPGKPIFKVHNLSGKESACSAGDAGSVPGSGISPGEGNGYPLQYSCLENPMDRGAWLTTVHGVAKSWTRLSG